MTLKTTQQYLKQPSSNLTRYSLFVGGLNATKRAIEQYDPLRLSSPRIFFVKMPPFLKALSEEKTKNFKHLLEYGFVSVNGLSNITLETDQITGGYNGRSFDVATFSRDDTNEITIRLYEFSGSPVREYLSLWVTGISDNLTGYGHYHGAREKNGKLMRYSQANHTAEAIYVRPDPTGRSDSIEYACLFCNMMPKLIDIDHFNYESGSSPIIQIDIPFTCVKYESADINRIAVKLMEKYQILTNYLDFRSGYTEQDVQNMPASTIENLT